jgi:ADP-ribosyl-[dinitrogen reductase] hydrolase
VRRARAALLGGAVGDALGATTEFMKPAQIRERIGVHREITGGGWLNLLPGQVTDDTEMTLCVARGIVQAREWNLAAIADRFAHWLSGEPADVGATCRRGILEYVGTRRLAAAPNEWDAGNGAAMRVAPVALYTLGDEELLSRLAVEQAHITHHHPLSDAACVAVGRLIQRGLLRTPLADLRATAEELAARHPEFRLVKTVNRGGDADTAGAIAGAIAGARYGLAAIPRRWVNALDAGLREELASLAEQLVRNSPLFAEASPR